MVTERQLIATILKLSEDKLQQKENENNGFVETIRWLIEHNYAIEKIDDPDKVHFMKIVTVGFTGDCISFMYMPDDIDQFKDDEDIMKNAIQRYNNLTKGSFDPVYMGVKLLEVEIGGHFQGYSPPEKFQSDAEGA